MMYEAGISLGLGFEAFPPPPYLTATATALYHHLSIFS